MPDAIDPAKLREVVAQILSEANPAGEPLTARQVREQAEQRLGLKKDALEAKRDELMDMINGLLVARGQAEAEARIDPKAVKEAVSAIEDADGGPTKAALLVAELSADGAAAEGGLQEAGAQAIELLAEVCAASALASSRLLDAGVSKVLAALIHPSVPKTSASLALRMVSGMSTHKGVTEAIIKAGLVSPVLARLVVSIDGVGIQAAALCHNLADSPGNRMRMMNEGTLGALTRVILEPAASAQLKEHALQAAASLAGKPEAECSFPELLGGFISMKLPGTQREALNALDLVREKQPGIEGRLQRVPAIMEGLQVAAASRDPKVAASARMLFKTLQDAVLNLGSGVW
jgi:hypothetical protein